MSDATDSTESGSVPRRVAAIDWERWRPVDRATLLFVIHEGRILLIRKKRGLGAGKINGPGGRIEPGETAEQAAIRETDEELGFRASGLRPAGELRFQFVDAYSIHVFVFRAGSYEGHPAETEEAIPLWHPLDDIPYDEMWADDRIWVPHLLAERPFSGRFVFDEDRLLDHEIEVEDEIPE